jgi:hypothetical protein
LEVGGWRREIEIEGSLGREVCCRQSLSLPSSMDGDAHWGREPDRGRAALLHHCCDTGATGGGRGGGMEARIAEWWKARRARSRRDTNPP